MTLRDLHWSLYFLVWTSGIVALGVILGTLIFPLVGLLAGLERAPAQLALIGAKTLGFYFMIWAPGIALVLTVKNAYERRQHRDRPATDLK